MTRVGGTGDGEREEGGGPVGVGVRRRKKVEERVEEGGGSGGVAVEEVEEGERAV